MCNCLLLRMDLWPVVMESVSSEDSSATAKRIVPTVRMRTPAVSFVFFLFFTVHQTSRAVQFIRTKMNETTSGISSVYLNHTHRDPERHRRNTRKNYYHSTNLDLSDRKEVGEPFCKCQFNRFRTLWRRLSQLLFDTIKRESALRKKLTTLTGPRLLFITLTSLNLLINFHSGLFFCCCFSSRSKGWSQPSIKPSGFTRRWAL